MASLWRQATVGIAVAVAIVLANHWRLILQLQVGRHANDLPPSHPLTNFRAGRRRQTSRPGIDAKKPVDGDPYILSPICGGCYRSRSKDGKHCSDIVKARQKRDESSVSAAASAVGREYSGCEMCNASYCVQSRFNNTRHAPQIATDKYRTKYWRFDWSAPKFTNPTTLTLNSIPSELRMPPSRFRDASAYFQEMYNASSSQTKGMDFFFEYNPGIVAIPAKIKQHLPKEAAYLLSLRVTPANNCFPASTYERLPKEIWNAIYQGTVNHLGLALMDDKYQIIPGYDLVIDVGEGLGLKLTGEPVFMDYRLFVLNEEVYLHANADTVVISKLLLRGKDFGNFDIGVGDQQKGDRLDQPYVLKNLYGGDNLQVILAHYPNSIWRGGIHGKNYALFSMPNATNPNAPGSIYAEIDITPRHRVQQIDPESYFIHPLKRLSGRIDREVIGIDKKTESADAPLASFSTVDEHWFHGADAPFKEGAHGGACCVHFSMDELNLGRKRGNLEENLLVGVAHTKVQWKPWYSKKNIPQEKKDKVPHTHYASFFYAFDAHPPFQIRARSGYFCLGHSPLSSGNELGPGEGGSFNPHSALTRNRMLKQNNETFDCPQMHYISSFIEKADDPTKTIIGYGLNDCTGRIVEVEKKEILRLLYPDPMDMVFDAP